MYTILIFHLFSGCFAVECFLYPLQVCFIPCFSNYILFVFLKRRQSSYPSQSCPFLQLSWHLWPSLMSVQRVQCVFRYSNSGCCRSDRKLVLVWHPPEIQGSFYERQELNDVCEGMQISFSDETGLTELWGAQSDYAGVLWLCTELVLSRISLYCSVDIPVWKQTVNTHSQMF